VRNDGEGFSTLSFTQSLPEEKLRVAVIEFDEKGEATIKNAGYVRCADRNRYSPDIRRNFIGFRCAQSP